MFALGHIHFKYHTLWVTTPAFSLEPYQQGADQLPYYEVKLTKKEILPSENEKVPVPLLWNFYVDIINEPIINAVMEVDSKKQPLKDFTDLIQYQTYLDRKGSSQPLYKLSKKNIELLIGMLEVLSK
jgi:hypothetical protein